MQFSLCFEFSSEILFAYRNYYDDFSFITMILYIMLIR